MCKGIGMLSWKWVWLTLGLAGFTWVIAHRDATGQDKTNATTPPPQEASRPASPIASPVTPSLNAATAPTTSAPGYSLDFYGRIAPAWLDVDPPNSPPSISFDAVEVGDVTGDGRNDVIAVQHGAHNTANYGDLFVFAQTSGGALAAGVHYPVPIDTDGSSFTALGDFNEDRKQDIVVVGYKKFTMFLTKAGGGFDAVVHDIYDPVELGTETPAAVMDVNRDGHLDLVFFMTRTHAGSSGHPTSETHSRIVVHYGDGLGGFAGRWFLKTYGNSEYDVENAVSLDTGDVSGDGWPDLVIRSRQYDFGLQSQVNQVRVFANTAQGQLVPTVSFPATMVTGVEYSAMDYIALGDFNGDGRQDIAGATGSMDERVWIKLQSSTGGFDAAPLVRTTQPIGDVVEVADLDNSGGDDMLIGHDGWARVTYYLQSGGQPGEEQMRDIASSDARIGASGLAIGDLNGDGCKDAAVAQGYYGVYVMRGSNCKAKRPLPKVQVCSTQEAKPAGTSAPLAIGRAPAQAMQWAWSSKANGWVAR